MWSNRCRVEKCQIEVSRLINEKSRVRFELVEFLLQNGYSYQESNESIDKLIRTKQIKEYSDVVSEIPFDGGSTTVCNLEIIQLRPK
jgi:cell shape-determining protein MreC